MFLKGYVFFLILNDYYAYDSNTPALSMSEIVLHLFAHKIERQKMLKNTYNSARLVSCSAMIILMKNHWGNGIA